MEKEQIDGCVILEILLEQKRDKEQRLLQQACRRYVHRVRDQHNGFLSLSALGEVFRSLYDIEDYQVRMRIITGIYDLLRECHINFSAPSFEAYAGAKLIGDSDTIIKAADALRVAEAITNSAILVTIDKQLIENKTLQKRFSVTIRAPY